MLPAMLGIQDENDPIRPHKDKRETTPVVDVPSTRTSALNTTNPDIRANKKCALILLSLAWYTTDGNGCCASYW